MSRIFFHAEQETVAVLGSERAYLAALADHVATGVFELAQPDQLAALVPERHWMREVPTTGFGSHPLYRERFRAFLRTAHEERFADGELVWDVVLNTALRLGGDALKLAVRIHAQCELHAWVEAEHCAWLAGIVEEARAVGVCRDTIRGHDTGWKDVGRLLCSEPGPVVTSYSVCESFPNASIAAWEPERDKFGGVSDEAWDAWYDLPEAERWELGLTGLREQERPPRLDPDTWDHYYFAGGRTAFDLLALNAEAA